MKLSYANSLWHISPVIYLFIFMGISYITNLLLWHTKICHSTMRPQIKSSILGKSSRGLEINDCFFFPLSKSENPEV